jgi:hypothetical protein
LPTGRSAKLKLDHDRPTRVRGLRKSRLALDAPADVPRVWRHALLRRLTQPSRDEACGCDGSPRGRPLSSRFSASVLHGVRGVSRSLSLTRFSCQWLDPRLELASDLEGPCDRRTLDDNFAAKRSSTCLIVSHLSPEERRGVLHVSAEMGRCSRVSRTHQPGNVCRRACLQRQLTFGLPHQDAN